MVEESLLIKFKMIIREQHSLKRIVKWSLLKIKDLESLLITSEIIIQKQYLHLL